MKQLQKDLTEGSVAKGLMLFSVPFLLTNLLQALTNLADMVIVGRYVGAQGIAAVQVGGQVVLILTNMVAGLAMGATVLIGQYQGAGKQKEQKETIGTLMALFAVVGAGSTVLLLSLSSSILKLLRTPEAAFADARAYLLICSAGCLFLFGFQAISAVLRGMGDSTRPLYFMLISAVVNIALDYIFIRFLNMRAAGAALGAVLAEMVSLSAAVIYLVRKNFAFDFKPKSFRFYKGKTSLICRIGLPTTVQYSITGLSFLLLTGLANHIAGVVGATMLGIGSRINSFGVLPCQAMSSSISAMTAQNVGANKPDRAKKATLIGCAVAFGVSALVFVLVALFPQQITGFFLSNASRNTGDANLVRQCLELGPKYLFWVGFDYLFAAVFFSTNGIATGSGHTWFAMINSAINALVLRIPAAYLLTSSIGGGLGMMGMAYAIGLAPSVSAVIGTIYLFSGKWKKPRIPLAEGEKTKQPAQKGQ